MFDRNLPRREDRSRKGMEESMDAFKRFVELLGKKEAVEKEMMVVLSEMERSDLAANARLLRAHAADSKELGKAFTRAARAKVPGKRGRPFGSKNAPKEMPAKKGTPKKAAKTVSKKTVVSKSPKKATSVKKVVKVVAKAPKVALAGSKLPKPSAPKKPSHSHKSHPKPLATSEAPMVPPVLTTENVPSTGM